jgi:hypothetical protein
VATRSFFDGLAASFFWLRPAATEESYQWGVRRFHVGALTRAGHRLFVAPIMRFAIGLRRGHSYAVTRVAKESTEAAPTADCTLQF